MDQFWAPIPFHFPSEVGLSAIVLSQSKVQCRDSSASHHAELRVKSLILSH